MGNCCRKKEAWSEIYAAYPYFSRGVQEHNRITFEYEDISYYQSKVIYRSCRVLDSSGDRRVRGEHETIIYDCHEKTLEFHNSHPPKLVFLLANGELKVV